MINFGGISKCTLRTGYYIGLLSRSSDQFWGVMVDRRFGIQLLLTGEFHGLPAVSKRVSPSGPAVMWCNVVNNKLN